MSAHALAAERLRTLLRAHDLGANRAGLIMVTAPDLRMVLDAYDKMLRGEDPNEPAQQTLPWWKKGDME